MPGGIGGRVGKSAREQRCLPLRRLHDDRFQKAQLTLLERVAWMHAHCSIAFMFHSEQVNSIDNHVIFNSCDGRLIYATLISI